jgi:glycosidase
MFAPAWVKDAIFYQIFPDRFCRSERYHAVGKFVPWGSKPTRENMFGGYIAGIEDKLEYIAGLGVNAVYLCPIFKSNSNHRYHTVDYFEIDPVLGTLEDFDRLVKKAHKLKLRVILDGVFNHCSRGFFQFNSLMELGEQFLGLFKKQYLYLMYVWGHSYEFDDRNNWDLMERFCAMMGGKDDIWYCTNIEFMDCMDDYQRLQFAADNSFVFNPNARDCWVSVNDGTIVRLPAGETVRF